MHRIATILGVVGLFVATTSDAGEIGYIEDFALAKDRAVPLKQLIPGTENYYYYHCLHLQNTEQFDKVENLLKQWIKRYKYTVRVREIENRQALLTYNQNPQKSLNFIQRRLGILFNHQRERLNAKPNLPLTLNQDLISRPALTKRALQRYSNLQGFEDVALDWVLATELNADRRRHLLQRLGRPDYSNLPKLVINDLNYKYSGGFGSLGIHRQLLLSQLEDCLKLKPELRNQTNFVNTYLVKLRPSADVDWRHNSQEHAAYLDRLWGFVSQLQPVHNSLKAHVLYQRLVFDRARGVYNKQRFMDYIQLPRHVSYINSNYMKLDRNRRYPANLQANFSAITLFPLVGNDEPLVRSYLHHFFVKETTYKPYEPFINDIYLKHNFAETKIVNGLGEPEQWYSMLPPEKYQALKERIDLDFADTNKPIFAADEAVGLDLYVKNVKTLIVKVYEINTRNFYRDNLREVDTDINLDGLVANEEATHKYPEPQLRRVLRHFDFPALTKPGTYVVDFIGNGKSSRALIRKGKLRYLARTSTAGQIFTVLDENKKKLLQATLWISGRDYTADEEGTITVPFSNRPGRQPIILSHGSLSSLDFFEQASENYALTAGIYVDRESLLKRKKSFAVIRPSLSVNGIPVTLSVLEDVRLVLQSTDRDGVSTSKEVADFKLFEDRESIYEFQVPPRLSQISFQLKAKIQNLSQNKKIPLLTQQSFSLNAIDKGEQVDDLHFANMGGAYIIDLSGKSGEARIERPVRLSIKHRDFRSPVNVSLQTNDEGRIVLGALQDISSVTATGPSGKSHTWNLRADVHSYYQTVHGKSGETLELPYMGTENKANRDELSLLETRGGTFIADRFDSLSVKNGLVRIGKLPAGDYDLLFKDSGEHISLKLTAGERRDDYVLGDYRRLEVRGDHPLQIERVNAGEKVVTVRLRNATKFARVHVFATRYQPAFAPYPQFARVRDAEPYQMFAPKFESVYVAGRNIGDEYRYIIDRQYAKKHPGNMLGRPSLLLNPWAIRKTETVRQEAQIGNDFEGRGTPPGALGGRPPAKRAPVVQLADFSNLDFLADASAMLLNLKPNKKGIVSINRDELGTHQQIHIVAVDPVNTAYRAISLTETPTNYLDLRLADGLDPAKHYTQQKQISIVAKGGQIVIPDITTSRFETYDNLRRVYSLLVTLSQDPKLIEFGFVLDWQKLKPEEKRAKYSKYACHELNFFLFKKDPEFFRTAVQPYLRNKKDSTFLDRFLIGDELGEYLDPWNFSQLNIAERILLSQRIKGEQQYTSRHVGDLFDLIPPDIERFNHLFNTALQGRALETGDALGLDDARDAAAEMKQNGRKLSGGFGNFDRAKRLGQSPNPSAAATPSEKAASRRANGKLKETEELAKKMDKDGNAQRDQLRRARNKDAKAFYKSEGKKRQAARQYYRKLDKTQEWVENNYYHLPIEQQNADLITVNAFWNDYAEHDPASAFYSINLAEASRNFPEMMFVLSLLDLPFDAEEHQTKFDQAKMTLSPGNTMVVFHEEIKLAKSVAEKTPILVSQNFYRHGDRYRHVNGERRDKYVTDEFLVHTVYGCQVVVTNPTSSRQKLDVLLQIPNGALPVLNGKYTRSVHFDLQPYNTQTIEYYFYFPATGLYQHYPVHIAKNEELIAFAEPVSLKVVDKLSTIDRGSWAYLSQYGSNADVLEFLKANNLHRINLDKIAFRTTGCRHLVAVHRLFEPVDTK